ncbi:DUF1295 domain protein [Zalerion maritima]|uniref:DUF1295 domain protein n=1 Tax=Zalerion maritima TaxID=339359 RepID=A0AAD5RLJ8_9PEZI|nr:DUF1295 domain protein [Zalerion maritima]
MKMAIPTLNAIEECADFSQTVGPFIPQLLEVPQKLMAVESKAALVDLYLNTNPLVTGLSLSLLISVLVLAFSEVNKNYSQVDRIWSMVPAVYVGNFALWARLAGIAAPRVDLAWAFSIIWSARLTYNYWRKGGYEVGSEDYRWPIVRKQIHPVLAFVFNVVFISLIQNILLYSLTVPVYSMLLSSQFESEVTTGDLLFYGVELILVFTEGVSDQQQWDFHSAKHEYQKTAKVPKGSNQVELDRGFLTSGLWSYSRHPNFACEQTVWFCLYQWSCYSSNILYSWAGLGSFSLFCLFQGSTWLTEKISAEKYPEYKEYQKQVSMFVPISFSGYTPPELQPKAARTSELEEKTGSNEQPSSGGVRRRGA